MSLQDIKDRVPTNVLDNGAIRYGVYDENNNLLRYEYIKREDAPTEAGTDINRALFRNLQGDVYTQCKYNNLAVSEYGEKSFTNDLLAKQNWLEVTSLTDYRTMGGIELTASSSYDASSNPTKAVDGFQGTRWIATGASSHWFKIKFPSPIKITKLKTLIMAQTESTLTSIKFQGSNDNSIWTDLHTLTASQSTLTEITLNNADYYQYYRIYGTFNTNIGMWIYELQVSEYVMNTGVMTLELPLTSYETGKIINIIGKNYNNINSFKMPYLNINNLGNKLINGTIINGERYSLVFNGESWDILEKGYVIGIYTGDGATTQTINLGFTPSAVIVASENGIFYEYSGSKDQYYGGVALNGMPAKYNDDLNVVEIVDSGFAVSSNSSNRIYANLSARVYKYIAFK